MNHNTQSTIRRAVRVVLVEDHPLMRAGTRASLEVSQLIEVVGMAGDGDEGLALVDRLQPNVLLLDIKLPGMNGVEVARRVRRTHPQVQVVILTGFDDAGYLSEVVRIGVRGYLTKSASAEEVIAAVLAAAEGRSSLPDSGRAGVAPGAVSSFTDREVAVLRLLIGGRRNAEIAEALSVSLKTVEFHVSHILQKMGARSRSEAIGIAARQGIQP